VGTVTRNLCGRQEAAREISVVILEYRKESDYLTAMTPVFDIKDRTRLRERFFGATRSVLARL